MSLVWRHSSLLGLVILCTANSAHATEVNVVGLFNGKAMVSINGGKHRVMAAGETSPEGVKLISADSSTAVLEIDGKRKNLGMGKSASIPSADGGGNQSAVLTADFVAISSLPAASTAPARAWWWIPGHPWYRWAKMKRSGSGFPISTANAASVSTANGVVPAYRVTLNTVRVGNHHAESGGRSGAGKQHALRAARHELPEKAGNKAGRD